MGFARNPPAARGGDAGCRALGCSGLLVGWTKGGGRPRRTTQDGAGWAPSAQGRAGEWKAPGRCLHLWSDAAIPFWSPIRHPRYPRKVKAAPTSPPSQSLSLRDQKAPTFPARPRTPLSFSAPRLGISGFFPAHSQSQLPLCLSPFPPLLALRAFTLPICPSPPVLHHCPPHLSSLSLTPGL